MASHRARKDWRVQVLPLVSVGSLDHYLIDPPGENALARRARLSGHEAGTGLRPLRRPLLGRPPPAPRNGRTDTLSSPSTWRFLPPLDSPKQWTWNEFRRAVAQVLIRWVGHCPTCLRDFVTFPEERLIK